MSGSPIGRRGDIHVAITVARATRAISGEKALHARRPAGRQTEAAYLVGPLGVQLPRRLTEKVSQESVTSEPDNSSQDNHGGADYYGNGNKGRKERHDTGSLESKAPVAGTRDRRDMGDICVRVLFCWHIFCEPTPQDD
jgi:hypothetical protein